MSPSGEEPKAAMSLSGEEPKAAMSPSGEEPKAAMSPSGEEPRAAMSLSGEEPKAAMSLSGEEPKAAMSLSGEVKIAASRLREELRAAIRPIATVVAGMAVVGVLVGVAWLFLSPPVHGVIALNKAGNRLYVYLGSESDRFFVSAVIMASLLAGVAVVTAVLVWQWRRQRGPRMVVALTLGGLAAAGMATGVGAGLARIRYGAIDIDAAPVSPENRIHYVVEAPPVFFGHTPMQILLTLLVPVGIAALTYGVLAAASAHDDLGVGASVAEPVMVRQPVD